MTTDDGTDRGRARELVVITFGPNDLESLRLSVARETSPYLPVAQVGEMVLAVYEVALNSIEHGAGKGIVRVTHTGTELVFDIRDHDGTLTDPTVQTPRQTPPTGADYGWLST